MSIIFAHSNSFCTKASCDGSVELYIGVWHTPSSCGTYTCPSGGITVESGGTTFSYSFDGMWLSSTPPAGFDCTYCSDSDMFQTVTVTGLPPGPASVSPIVGSNLETPAADCWPLTVNIPGPDTNYDDPITGIDTCPGDVIINQDADTCIANIAAPVLQCSIGTACPTYQCTVVEDAGNIYNNLPLGDTINTWEIHVRDGSSGPFSPSGVFCTHTITVIDATNPSFTPQSDYTATCSSPSGANVSFNDPTDASDCNSPVTFSYTPSSGSVFPIGTTNVSFQVSDSVGNVVNDNFDVIVQVNPPSLTFCPFDLLITSVTPSTDPSTPATAFISYPIPTALDSCFNNLPMNHQSGPMNGSTINVDGTSVTVEFESDPDPNTGATLLCSFDIQFSYISINRLYQLNYETNTYDVVNPYDNLYMYIPLQLEVEWVNMAPTMEEARIIIRDQSNIDETTLPESQFSDITVTLDGSNIYTLLGPQGVLPDDPNATSYHYISILPSTSTDILIFNNWFPVRVESPFRNDGSPKISGFSSK